MRDIAIHASSSVAPAEHPFLSAGFRPFFFLGAIWSAVAVPLWLAAYTHGYAVGGALPAAVWHAHEMISGFGAAAVAGFLLTAIPNWTERLPIRGEPLAALVALWLAGRVALLASAAIGPALAALVDLAFPLALIAVVARELIAGRNFHNVPVAVALGLLAASSVLVHLHAGDLAYTAALGERLGIAVLLLLIALVGGRILPSFTRNWLAPRGAGRMPAQPDAFDNACLLVILAGLVAWVSAPDWILSPGLEIAAGVAVAARLARWRGLATIREPLLFVLHAGYGWLAAGLVLLGANGIFPVLPPSAPVHALTVGAIGTMTLAVMTRASLGHTGRALSAGAGTTAIYLLVTLAALLRVAAPLAGAAAIVTSLAGLAWAGAFGLFAFLYAPVLLGKKQ